MPENKNDKLIKRKIEKSANKLFRDSSRLADAIEDFMVSRLGDLTKNTRGRGELSKLSKKKRILKKIRDRGLKKLKSQTEDFYESIIDEIEDILRLRLGDNANISGVTAAQLRELISLSDTAITDRFERNVRDIRNVIARSVLLGEQVPIRQLRRSSDATTRSDATIINTELSGFYTNTTLITAVENEITHFEYFGNIQDNTRDFCKEHVGKIYTLDELRKLDNGQGLPVVPYLGGYNCRHRLVPVFVDEDDNG